jgi:hypothetical protein
MLIISDAWEEKVGVCLSEATLGKSMRAYLKNKVKQKDLWVRFNGSTLASNHKALSSNSKIAKKKKKERKH